MPIHPTSTPLVLAPPPLRGKVGATLDPAFAETASKLFGWEQQHSPAPSAFPAITPCHALAEPPAASEAASLQENEYVACKDGEGTFLFLADGYVQFPRHSRETRLGRYSHIQDQAGPHAPVSALETALFRALLLQQTLLLHALVFNYRGQGYLVLGESGAGKSTLGLAALAAGARIVSDDRIALRRDGGAILAYSMRPFLHIRRNTLQKMNSAALPATLLATDPDNPGKVVERASLADAFIDHTVIDNLLLLPAATGSRPADSRFSRATRAEGLAATIASSLPYFFTLDPEDLGGDPGALCLQLLEVRRCAHLATGSHLMDNPKEEFTRLIDSLDD